MLYVIKVSGAVTILKALVPHCMWIKWSISSILNLTEKNCASIINQQMHSCENLIHIVAWRRIHDHRREHTAYKRRFSWWCLISWNGQWDEGWARYHPLLRIDNGIIDYILTSNNREHYKELGKGFSCLSHGELANVEAIFMVAMRHVPQKPNRAYLYMAYAGIGGTSKAGKYRH